MEKAKKSNTDWEDARSDEQWNETIEEKTKLFEGGERRDNCVERELAVKSLLQSFPPVLLEVEVRVPGKLCSLIFSKLFYLRMKTKMNKQMKTWNL